ncbi:hypothetical protein EV193_104387 [Herbihabitans rhizosphaerae]|uniref:Uncharacterized protein n=1 Tax=Herbihabitans rhizosphaerae TaxID=1872711 RepID=A0A4Q7KTL9_9PSEU|nr:hypothetical protein [Herbihabitans rhizosphaerae]RZS39171.1 hypothetical protein EV193_104387 [Herbihabitans rhizosphaerae]
MDISPLAATAMQLNELYAEFVRAGFTPEQAMQMVCTVLAANVTSGDA